MLEINNFGALPETLNDLLTESALKGFKRQVRYPDHRFFGLFCSYFPEEIILAAGLEPLRLLPSYPNATPAELPTYCCSLARGILEMAIQGEFSDLVGVGFAHTCDTMQCLSGIWSESVQTPTVNLVPPVVLTNPGAARYYCSEMTVAWQELQQLSGHKATEEDLRQALELCRSYRRLVAEIDELRPLLPSPVVSAILRAGQLMPRSHYLDVLTAVMPTLREMAAPDDNRARILISGAILESDSLYSLLEELGGRVVADDSCTGFRHYADASDNSRLSEPTTNVKPSAVPFNDLSIVSCNHSSTNPSTKSCTNFSPNLSTPELMAQIAERYMKMPPCPCKHQGLAKRFNYLTTLASHRAAEGAILVIRKFCDPHAWDAVDLARRLQEQGLKTLILELEGADAGGQERTRLQAFLESIVADRR